MERAKQDEAPDVFRQFIGAFNFYTGDCSLQSVRGIYPPNINQTAVFSVYGIKLTEQYRIKQI